MTYHSDAREPQGSFLSRETGLTFIEQLHAICIHSCEKENRPYLVGVSETDKQAILLRPHCKQWNCRTCSARNARTWLAKIINHINIKSDERWFFWTITAHERWRGVERSVKNLRAGWKKLINRIGRRFSNMQYVRVWESHKDGSFHLHILINIDLTKRSLKSLSRACGMGYQCDAQEIQNAGQAAGYVAKYFLKSEVIGNYPRGLRRIEASRNWTKLPDLKAATLLTWYLNQTREGQIRTAAQFYDRGFEIIDTLRGKEDGELL